jgi:hypothetical protein
VVCHTLERSRTDQIKCIISQPGVVSQLVEAYAHSEHKNEKFYGVVETAGIVFFPFVQSGISSTNNEYPIM